MTDTPPDAPRLTMRELRANLAHALRRAEAGESIVVTVSARPVAQLSPLSGGAAVTLDELIAAGLVRAPRRRVADVVDPAAVRLPLEVDVDDILASVRGR